MVVAGLSVYRTGRGDISGAQLIVTKCSNRNY